MCWVTSAVVVVAAARWVLEEVDEHQVIGTQLDTQLRIESRDEQCHGVQQHLQ